MSVDSKPTGTILRSVPTRWVVMALGALIVGIGVLFSGLNYIVSSSFKQSTTQSEILMSSMRSHMTADMMHDSLRGVVFHAMYAGATADAAMIAASQAELAEYSAEFRASIAAQDQLDVPASVKAAATAVKEPLDGYLKAGLPE